MMKNMIEKPLEERFAFWIVDDHYRLLEAPQTIVQEETVEGLARVQCFLPTSRVFELTLEGKDVVHLKSKKCADGIFLVENQEGQWELHIIECKKTINRSKWEKTKVQFETTIQRALGLLAGVGVFPQRIKLYTAVRNDEEIKAAKNTDPTLRKMTLHEWRQLSDERKEKTHYMDWFDQTIDIWVQRDIPHEQIHLDENGDGTVTIG